MDHIYILITILLTAYAQIIMKWQAGVIGSFPANGAEQLQFFLKVALNPWIISALGAAYIGVLSWMVALSKFQLSYAYPFYSITFPLVIALSALVFDESLNLLRFLGVAVILVGLYLISRT